MEGKNLKGYKFEKSVGQGSFGKVYKALKDGNVYAIKAIELAKPGAAKTAEMEEFVGKQIRLRNPFVTDYIDTFRNERGDVLYIVMEFCGGGDLESMIEKLDFRYGAGMTEDKLMKIVIHLSLGLGALHQNKILHRDIKAGNAIFDSDGHLKICDFGCGKQLEDTMGLAFKFTGTLLYLAPEIYRGLPYNYPADVWSLGILFYYLCVGRLPFTHPQEVMIGELVKKGKFAEIPEGNCSAEMQSIINAILLRQNPQSRPSVFGILRHPFIQEWADRLDLKKFFPSDARKPSLASEFTGVVSVSLPKITDTDTGTGAGSTTRLDEEPTEEEITEFMQDTARAHPEYTGAQFKSEYLENVGKPATLGRLNAFRKMQQLYTPASGSSSGGNGSSSSVASGRRVSSGSGSGSKDKISNRITSASNFGGKGGNSSASSSYNSIGADTSVQSFVRAVVQEKSYGMGDVQQILWKGNVVAIRMAKAVDKRVGERNLYRGWHGTRVSNILSIIRYGLHKPGERVGGKTVELNREAHMHDEVENWSEAIFLANSVSYAASEKYAGRIASEKASEGVLCVLVEAVICSGGYSEHYLNVSSCWVPADDCTDAEWKVARIEKAENVVVTAITLLSEKFLKGNELDCEQLNSLVAGDDVLDETCSGVKRLPMGPLPPPLVRKANPKLSHAPSQVSKYKDGREICEFDQCCAEESAGHNKMYAHPWRDVFYVVDPTYTKQGCCPLCDLDEFCTDTSRKHSQYYQHPRKAARKNTKDTRPFCAYDEYCANKEKTHLVAFQHPRLRVKVVEATGQDPCPVFDSSCTSAVAAEAVPNAARSGFYGFSKIIFYSCASGKKSVAVTQGKLGPGFYFYSSLMVAKEKAGNSPVLECVVLLHFSLELSGWKPDMNEATANLAGCATVHGGTSGGARDEYVVYNSNQIKIMEVHLSW